MSKPMIRPLSTLRLEPVPDPHGCITCSATKRFAVRCKLYTVYNPMMSFVKPDFFAALRLKHMHCFTAFTPNDEVLSARMQTSTAQINFTMATIPDRSLREHVRISKK